MNKLTKATAITLCTLTLCSPFGFNAKALESDISAGSGEQIQEISEISTRSGDKYLDLSNVRAADVKILLNGTEIIKDKGKIINSTTYIPLRAFTDSVTDAKISWNQSTRTATVETAYVTIKAPQGALYLEVNGRYFYTVEPIANIDGTLYVPIRPLAKALGLELLWDNSLRAVKLTSGNPSVTNGSSFYKSDEVLWLARIIHAEAAGEPFDGKIAVGNVVLNRVASPMYPNTIYGVIFDRKNGTQFSPVSFGTIYNTPNADSVIAAKICLEGYSLSTDALFFMNPRIATSNWISKNRPYLFTIGRHDFYG